VLVALAFPAGAAPDEDLLGKAAGYPIGTRANWFYDEGVRVGSFSNADKILPHYTLAKSTTPLLLSTTAAASKIEYRFENQSYSLDDFLARQRVTGFLLIREGEVLAERYQYNRNAENRFVSHSMAKSIVSLAVGMALAEKKIASLDDTIAKYVPELAGNPYGETTIRNMLRMASGVPQANGQVAIEPLMDVAHVASSVLYMASLPLDANVQFLTVMATKMPFVGRG